MLQRFGPWRTESSNYRVIANSRYAMDKVKSDLLLSKLGIQGPRCYKTFFNLNSREQEIYPAHKC